MTEIDYSKYEIVGFNGDITGVCGRALALGHAKSTNDYFLADYDFFQNGIEHHSVVRRSFDEIKGFEEERRLTLLETPFPMVKDAQILYTSEGRLYNLGLIPRLNQSGLFDNPFTNWQKLPMRDIWIAYSDENTIARLLNAVQIK